MKNRRNLGLVLLPAVLSAGRIGGVFIGKEIFDGSRSPNQDKLIEVRSLIDQE